MNNTKYKRRSISQIMGQLIGLALLLIVAVCTLLLIPGMVLISWIDDLVKDQIATSVLWLLSIAISAGIYGLIRFLMKNSEKSWKLYGGICIAALILCITLSVGFQQHFGQRWSGRLMGISSSPQIRNDSPSLNH